MKGPKLARGGPCGQRVRRTARVTPRASHARPPRPAQTCCSALCMPSAFAPVYFDDPQHPHPHLRLLGAYTPLPPVPRDAPCRHRPLLSSPSHTPTCFSAATGGAVSPAATAARVALSAASAASTSVVLAAGDGGRGDAGRRKQRAQWANTDTSGGQDAARAGRGQGGVGDWGVGAIPPDMCT